MEVPAGERPLNRRGAAGLLAVAAWGLLLVMMLAGHPALAGDGETARVARDIARGTSGAAGLARSIVTLDRGAAPSAMAFVLAVGYLGFWLLNRGLPESGAPRPAGPARAALQLGAALVGHAAAAVAAALGAGPGLAIGLGAGLTGIGAATALFRPGAELPSPRPAASPARRALLVTGSMLVATAAFPLDLALAAATGVLQFPEAWFPVAVGLGSEGSPAGGLAIAVALSAAAFFLERTRERAGDSLPGAFFLLAPATILLLGPAAPFRGAAAALSAAVLFRAGAGPILRAAVILAPSAALVAAALAA